MVSTARGSSQPQTPNLVMELSCFDPRGQDKDKTLLFKSNQSGACGLRGVMVDGDGE